MISSNELRNGVTIIVDGNLWTVIEFLHVKPGKGSAFVRTRLKNVKTGATLERTFRAGEKLERATVDNRQMQMLYNDADGYHFMDQESFENFTIQRDLIGGPGRLPKRRHGRRRAVSRRNCRSASICRRTSSCGSSKPIPASRATRRPTRPSRPSSKPARPFRSRCSSKPDTVIRIDTRDRRYIGRVS